MAMSKDDYKYDEQYEEADAFTLEDDAASEKRKQLLQYILVSAFAVVVIALALWASIWLTQIRLKDQASEGTAAPSASDGPAVTAGVPTNDYWPEEQFAGIPQFEASGYDTRVNGQKAMIGVPALSVSGFGDYAERLADLGAAVYVNTQRLVVLSYEDVEIHLISSGSTTAVTLCGESEQRFDESEYADFPLPGEGRLVSVTEGTGARSRVLIYRHASSTSAQEYCVSLSQQGWKLSGTLEPEDNVFLATYKKGDMQITVDYFSAGEDYKIKLDYVN